MDIIDLVSDLEEGEIIDDSPSSNSDKKVRELPQRYKFHEKNTPIQKHKKKDCKNSIRYHAKKIAKMKKSPKAKNSPKRHYKSTCSHEKSYKISEKSTKNVDRNFSKNGYSFPNSSLIAEIKCSLKDNFTKSQSTQHNSKIQADTNIKISNVFSLSEIGRENVDFQPENDIAYLKKDQAKVNNIKKLVNLDKEKSGSGMKISGNVTIDNSLLTENEESEDEAELRRIALATCAKRKPIIESNENLIQSVNKHILTVPESLEINNNQISYQESSRPASDNYEVVDMDVDEDIETSLEIPETTVKESIENLYVIDTNPSVDLQREIEKNTLTEAQTHNTSDEDFDTDILRAELVSSYYEKKNLEDEYAEQKKASVDMHPKQVPISTRKKNIGNYKKFSFYRKQLRTGKPISKKIIVNNKCGNSNQNVNKPSVSAQVNKSPKRLIIALNEESSSEDSDTESPVASIEALISDCRQKSDSNDKTQETVKQVPLAVSCLSKAAQEEYSSLIKILAENKKLQGPADQVQHKNGSVHSPQDDLKVLGKKLLECKVSLKKKKEFTAHLSKEISSKRLSYMKSKLTVEHLKQQCIAAEKITKVNFDALYKCSSDFKSAKKAVSNLESKRNQLQSLYSKLHASIQAQNFK